MSIGRTIGGAVIRLRTYESLEASQQDFKTLFEAMPSFVFILREDGMIAGTTAHVPSPSLVREERSSRSMP